MKEPSACIAGS